MGISYVLQRCFQDTKVAGVVNVSGQEGSDICHAEISKFSCNTEQSFEMRENTEFDKVNFGNEFHNLILNLLQNASGHEEKTVHEREQ